MRHDGGEYEMANGKEETGGFTTGIHLGRVCGAFCIHCIWEFSMVKFVLVSFYSLLRHPLFQCVKGTIELSISPVSTV